MVASVRPQDTANRMHKGRGGVGTIEGQIFFFFRGKIMMHGIYILEDYTIQC